MIEVHGSISVWQFVLAVALGVILGRVGLLILGAIATVWLERSSGKKSSRRQ